MWQSDRVSAANGWIEVLIQGVRVDISSIFTLIAIPLFISCFIGKNKVIVKFWSFITNSILTILFSTYVFMELATPSFINEYNIRPNRIFIEYLEYPKEVFSMLVKSHGIQLGFSMVLTFILGLVFWKFLSRRMQKVRAFPLMWRLPAFVLAVVVSVFLSRSTLGHRPLNPAMVYFSTDPLVNSLTLNSLHSVGFAAKQMMSEKESIYIYGHLSKDEIVQNVRKFKGVDGLPIFDPTIPTLAKQKSSYTGKQKNIVIILEESLGARFVGSLGGLPLTPNIDKLKKESWFFTSMFATGTRSVRGIEAVTTGFTPTPNRAVVKLDKSQNNFFTIAELLSRNGYHTEFIYGGEAHFDNMKGFFLGNGFQSIIEEKDYQNPVFKGSWGVSDEDLLNKAHNRFSQLKSDDKPFFSLVFSSSNHDPFEYPDNRIQRYDTQKHTRHNAIKYADWAIGDFFNKAKKSNYWEDTIFLIIADHDARVMGKDLVPPKSFHIPALILGKDIPAKVHENIVSQIDMPPTLLSLAGVENFSPMLGKDLTQQANLESNEAIMQYAENFGYLTENQMIILQPNKPALKYKFNKNSFELEFDEIATEQEHTFALAISSWGGLAYSQNLYRLPDESVIELFAGIADENK